ncbi:MAG: hypothetical protein UY21_C0008G0010 [Microgenomates group bacterium GW2011_GWA1_48_10]|uniref:Uncharacterized protein n=1 Tax=Candidatus Gottesmanbacteria bacterium RIFCSPHIGHO2_01_FULL_47_48 TaxID=1798381 RepID=A0A1F6A304_9BACT|nr:MAG: hypothetical protein UY21_C0008G0010 [Microgenomates group bacterium GW2011_GWA1_48_10]OGG19060.1 MAG: hypothetical protein A2721_00665 [Candidatus Gottesmanbacteria bacterium RIFCSPHIGHO2_01_FULL_47_48]
MSKSLPHVEQFNHTKHLPQTVSDKTSDLFYILTALYIASSEEKVITKLTLEKALFKTSQMLAENEGASFLNTYFYINTLGPHNNIFYKYLEELEKAGLIETQGRNLFLTPKGLAFISGSIDKIASHKDLLEVILLLKDRVETYSDNPNRAIEETHSQKVVDSTDRGKVKTVKELITEIKPEQQFERPSQFKYIDPSPTKKTKKMEIPARVINDLENALANVEREDFEKEENINLLFA